MRGTLGTAGGRVNVHLSCRHRQPEACLLNGMGRLVSEQAQPGPRTGIVTAGREENIGSAGNSVSPESGRHLVSREVSVDAKSIQVRSQRPLHNYSQARWQGPPLAER